VDRLRSAAGEPMAYERGWYAPHGLEGLLEEDLTGSLYSLLAQRYGMALDAAQQTVWAETADPALAELLTVRTGTPLLVFRRTSSAGRHVVEHVTSWYRGDRYQVRMTLNRQQEDGSQPAGSHQTHSQAEHDDAREGNR
jgi:GntR family transcriptional regulator, N-acetylglucosamine utilization regulator